jgi:hypothetical protein
MSAVSSQLKIKHYDGFTGNFVDSQYLAAAFDTGSPHVFDDILVQVYMAQNRFKSMPLLGLTRGMGNAREIDVDVVRWFAQGAQEKFIRIVNNLEAGNATPGIGGSSFRIEVDEDFVGVPEVLMGMHNEYPLQILSGPEPGTTGFIYEVRIQDNDTSRFYPPEYLEVGSAFCKAWTTVASEMNDEFGSMYTSSAYQLESQIGFFGQEFTVTDKALREHGRIGFPIKDSKGNKMTSFIPEYEMKMYDELEMSKNISAIYGRKDNYIPPNAKYAKKTGPGLRQQLADGHTQVFSGGLTESFLKDYLMDIFFARNDEGNRDVVMFTGTQGSLAFHEAMAEKANAFLTVDTNFIKDMGDRNLSFGAQFTHYRGPEGITVRVVKVPQYDNIAYCQRTHPDYPNMPLDSWRMTFVDFEKPSSSDMSSNIMHLEVKDSYSHGYVPGTIGPNGPIQGGMTVKKIAGYERWVQASSGIVVLDTSKTGELIFDIQ